jgi:hypothetical protein
MSEDSRAFFTACRHSTQRRSQYEPLYDVDPHTGVTIEVFFGDHVLAGMLGFDGPCNPGCVPDWPIRDELLRLSGRRRQGRTKAELIATILLPNSVAAHDIGQDTMDSRAKIFRENNTA